MNAIIAAFSAYLQAVVILLPILLLYTVMVPVTGRSKALWLFHRVILVLSFTVVAALLVVPDLLPPVRIDIHASSAAPSGSHEIAPGTGLNSVIHGIETVDPTGARLNGSGEPGIGLSGAYFSAAAAVSGFFRRAALVTMLLSGAGCAFFCIAFFMQRNAVMKIRETAVRIHRRRRLEIIYSDGVETPFVCGLLMVRIFLPASLIENPLRRIVILHEMTHVRHHHLVWQNTEFFLKTVFWYNPFSHVMGRTGELLREFVCDLSVTDRIPKKFYLKALVDCAGLILSPGRRYGCQGMITKGMLRKRIENLVETTGETRMNSFRKRAFILPVVCCLALFGTAVVSGQSIHTGETPAGTVKHAAGIQERLSLLLANPDVKLRARLLEVFDWNAWLASLSDGERAGVPGIWPVGEGSGRVTWDYGYHEEHPLTGKPCFHTGIDIARPLRIPVLGAAAGRVIETGNDKDGHGLYVLVGHERGFRTFYSHLGSITVKQGDSIVPGGQIGTVGSTGVSTGPHLHYEIRIGETGVNVNPWYFIPETARISKK